MKDAPLVSCIMPTADRREYVSRAIEYFRRQDYPARELVILDDGADAVADLVPADPDIRYIREPRRRTVGAKRNACIEAARGELILHWDDDDWHAPDRVTLQVEALLSSAAAICGIDRPLFYAPASGRAWEYVFSPGCRGLSGSTLAYRRSFWAEHRFADIDIGEDMRFVRSGRPAATRVLETNAFHVGIIHERNVSPKRPAAPNWREIPVDAIREIMRADFDRYAPPPGGGRATPSAAPPPATDQPVADQPAADRPAAEPVRNVFACLVHEAPDCVLDLVRNLRATDPDAPILLYDGSPRGDLLDPRLPWDRWGVERIPDPAPMKWGALHGFALACIGHLGDRDYETLTIVDSDQLALRPGYARFLAERLGDRTGLGLLSKKPARQTPDTTEHPAATALAERALWRPFLSRFPGGEEHFVHWSFWPGTVIFADAARAIHELWRDPELQAILARSRLWAIEEVLFPTLAALLGFRVAGNPCRQDWVKFRRRYSARDVDAALRAEDAFWIHPVPRRIDDPLRRRVRDALGHYRPAPPKPPAPGTAAPPPPLLPPPLMPIIAAMRKIPGWLSDEEAELMLLAARAALARGGAAGRIVEVGAFCGKATVGLAEVARAAGGRVVAVDRFDGIVGARDGRLERHPRTRARFDGAIAGHGLTDTVEVHTGPLSRCGLSGAFDLAVIDGLHDYAAVVEDIAALDGLLPAGARLAFHDYADYYPGVIAAVDELLAAGDWSEEARAGSLIVLRRGGGR